MSTLRDVYDVTQDDFDQGTRATYRRHAPTTLLILMMPCVY
jgi:hypothetical protein